MPAFCQACGQRLPKPAARYKFFRRGKWYWATPTGEKRPPRKGELYLSGAVPDVYTALNDLSTPYHIVRQEGDQA